MWKALLIIGIALGEINGYGEITQATPTDYEIKVIATILVAEAGIDGEPGMVGVAEVIRNRAQIKRKKPTDIVKQKGTFSSLLGQTLAGLIRMHAKHPQIHVAREIAYTLLTRPETLPNTTHHATHFDICNRTPWWARHTTVTAHIGHHKFYRGTF